MNCRTHRNGKIWDFQTYCRSRSYSNVSVFLTFPESKFQCSTGQFSPQLTWTRVKSCLGLVWYSLLSLFFQPPVKLLTARRRSTYCREGSESRGKRQAGTFHSCFAINNDHIFQPAKLSKKRNIQCRSRTIFFHLVVCSKTCSLFFKAQAILQSKKQHEKTNFTAQERTVGRFLIIRTKQLVFIGLII